MASLDVLDYLLKLDEALARLLPPGGRKMARREVKGVVEDMAFRFAIMDDRVMPEDIDYARALETLRPAPDVASVLARRAPVYRKRQIRKSVTTFSVLAVLVLFTFGAYDFITSEQAEALVEDWRVGSPDPVTLSESRSFRVEGGVSRLQFSAPVLVFTDKSGTRENSVTVTLLDGAGNIRYTDIFTSSNSVYAKTAIEAPSPGEWTIVIDFRDAAGTVEVTVLAVRPK